LEKSIPSRVNRIAACRNVYVEAIRESDDFRNSDFIVVADFDNRNSLLSSENIKVATYRPGNWSGLFANQAWKYYDIFALRHPIWCPSNILDEIDWYKKELPGLPAKEIATFNRMLKISKSRDLIEVNSAFGGLGIYRTSCFINHDYTYSESDSPQESEYVILNRKIVRGGGHLFIDPQLLNFRFIHHSLESISWLRKLYKSKKRLNRLMNTNKF